MGWITSLVFVESGTYYNIANNFRQFRIDSIEIDYQAPEISTQPTDNIKKIKFHSLYTWIFNSSDKSAQDLLAEESNNHHISRPLAWKLLTTKILRGVKQVIRCAKKMIYTLSLEKFDNNIKSLVKALKGNCKLLTYCGESESSIITNLLRVLKKSPSSEFNSYIRQIQEKYDDGTDIDLENFMRNTVMKYE